MAPPEGGDTEAFVIGRQLPPSNGSGSPGVEMPPLHAGPSLRRRASNVVFWVACALALALVIAPAVSIVGGVVARAAPHWHWSVLTTLGVGLGGGLENEIVGTFVLIIGVALLAGTVGILSGVYLADLCPEGRGGLLRGASEVLAGIPSIVLGYVGYVAFVVAFHWGFSLGAALVVLSVLVVPYIAKTTEVALRQVPSSYREGAAALGMSTTCTLRRITLRAALPGIATGMIVALAIALGETAPLLYTASTSQSLPHLAVTHSPIAYLTYPVWTFYNQPSASAQNLAFDAALLLVVLVVALIVVPRVLVAFTQRNSEAASAR